MNEHFVDLINQKGISYDTGIGYDEYIDCNDEVSALIQCKALETLSLLLDKTNDCTSDHISRLMEDLCDQVPTEDLVTLFDVHLFHENKWRVRSVLNLIVLCRRPEFVELLVSHDILNFQYSPQYVWALVELLKEYESSAGMAILKTAYENDIGEHVKYEIRELFRQKFDITLDKYDGLIDHKRKHLLAGMPKVIEDARVNFRKQKFKVVVKQLSKFDAKDLSPVGKKLLEMAKSKLSSQSK
jgi:hypothetical protein